MLLPLFACSEFFMSHPFDLPCVLGGTRGGGPPVHSPAALAECQWEILGKHQGFCIETLQVQLEKVQEAHPTNSDCWVRDS